MRKYCKRTIGIESRIIDSYLSGLSAAKVANLFGYKTKKTILDILQKYNIKKRSRHERKYNYKVFNKINSHEIAYILGLLFTDGYVYKNYAGLGIQLTKSDKYLLLKIAEFFGEACKVSNINCASKRKKGIKAKDMARLMIYSSSIALDAKKLGIVKQKTSKLKIEIPIPKRYRYSFLRGVIDGDGTIHFDKNGRFHCKFSTKSKQFAKQICNNFVEDSLKLYNTHNKTMWTIIIMGGQKKVISFLRKLYKNKGDLYLERKYEIVQNKIN